MNIQENKWQHKCATCPLAEMHLRAQTPEERDFISRFKVGELLMGKGGILINEGSHTHQLFTVLSGFGYRYKTLEDGRRQILGYVMPGDFIGLQASMFDEMQHTVEALSPMQICVFDRNRIFELFEKHPHLSYALTWQAASDERLADEHITSLGRRDAYERLAFYMVYLFERAKISKLNRGLKVKLPITQNQLADTLGLSLVHINKTLKKLKEDKLMEFKDQVLHILNADELKRVSFWPEGLLQNRPYL